MSSASVSRSEALQWIGVQACMKYCGQHDIVMLKQARVRLMNLGMDIPTSLWTSSPLFRDIPKYRELV